MEQLFSLQPADVKSPGGPMLKLPVFLLTQPVSLCWGAMAIPNSDICRSPEVFP